MFITSGEKRDGMAVYWCGDDREPKQFGVCFENGLFNIANQGAVESMLFGLTEFGKAVEKLGG